MEGGKCIKRRDHGWRSRHKRTEEDGNNVRKEGDLVEAKKNIITQRKE